MKPPLMQVVGMLEIQRIGNEIPAIIPMAGEAA
jgi:hypothetical protein